MKLSLTFLLALLFLQINGNEWHEFMNHCYTVSDTQCDFNTCISKCHRIDKSGSYPIEIESLIEMHFIRKKMIINTSDQYWVGLQFSSRTEREKPNADLWIPNTSKLLPQDKCVKLATTDQVDGSRGQTYLLGDSDCSSSFKVICEKYVDEQPVDQLVISQSLCSPDLQMSVQYHEINVPSENICPFWGPYSVPLWNCEIGCSFCLLCLGFTYKDGICERYRFTDTCSNPLLNSTIMLWVRQKPRC